MTLRNRLCAIILVPALVASAACNDEDPVITEPTPEPQLTISYIGSENCGFCHTETFNEFRKSGHPYKLNKVENGTPPVYPFSEVPNPPAGVSWNDVTYVIGGFGWKARFIGNDGYIITQGGSNQYNLATGEWVDYHKDELKPYDCGSCHTTGFRPEGNQDDLPGILGQWEFPGVQCEECHGPGSLHAESPQNVAMTIDTRAEACGSCHNRGGVNSDIPASGGFIRHHEQFNEMASSPHVLLECITCHDPHTGVKNNDQEGAFAIRATCEDCHSGARETLQTSPLAASMQDLACEDCHMPFAGKSAIAVDTYVGDIRTHLWTINSDSLANQFIQGGAFSSDFVTVEYACLGCHTDAEDTKEWASANALDVHGADFSSQRVKARTF
ncbi:MAG: multiheme c-type cytochrome [Gemmatimonadota bacterium]